MSEQYSSKENNYLSSLDQIIEEIIAELPLKERVAIANMNKEGFELLKDIFKKYVVEKITIAFDTNEYIYMINKLWSKLRKTYRLRVVK